MNRDGIALLRMIVRDTFDDLFAELEALTDAPGQEALFRWLEGEFIDDERLHADVAGVIESNLWRLDRRLHAGAAMVGGDVS